MRKFCGIAACAALALSACRFETNQSSAANMVPASDSERRVEQCLSSGGIEDACVLEEMKRTMLVANQS